MESVSCHQKGLVMGNILWSVDKKIYSDKEDHTLAITGWAITRDQSECDFILYGSGKELSVPEPSRCERADVAKDLKETKDIKEVGNVGFTVKIPEIIKLAEEHEKLQLALRAGDEKEIIWEATAAEVKDFCEESLIEYHIDEEQITQESILTVRGWVVNQLEPDEIFVQGTDGKVLECTITRQRRPDVEEAKGISEEEKRNLGFSITVNLENTNDQNICICFRGKDVQKIYTVNVKKIKRENTGLYQQMKLLSLKNRQKNQEYIKKNGIGRFIRYVRNSQLKDGDQDYEDWLKDHVAFRKELKRQRNAVFSYSPLISIVMVVTDTDEQRLKSVIDAYTEQTYGNWQLCLADACEGEETGEFLRKKYKKEIRLSYKKVTENNGISGNLNASLKLAMGEYVLFAGQEIIPEPDALFQMVKAITEKKADMIYTDEDEISADGKHYSEPEFKPDFNLFRLRENNYIGQFWAIRKEILEQAGKFDPEYDGAQDYDMLLRCSEQAENIVHIPKILCHSMKAENLITEEQEKKNWEAGRKALEEHYRRAEVSATAELADKKGWYRSHLTISGEPMISVIIPSKDHINDLELCISSIEEKTTWKNYEIIIVENNSVEKETFVYYETLKNRYPNVRILTWKKEFNYSAINNFAVREARGEYLLFLNNDVEIITESWLEEMLQLCQQKDVGMAGAKLYYPDDTIQHAGVVVGLGGVAAHVLCKLPRDAEGYMGRLRCVQEISAVTAACMMVKTSVFKAVGGFDEELKVAFNDIDLITEEQEKKNWEAGRKALEEHYRRAEVSATAELADKKGWYRSHLTISGEPMISVIIPSKDHINDLELCISSIEEKTTWKNYEIIIVENNSVEKETFVYYETLKNRYPNVRILTWKKEFNYSAINNFAVREARGEYLLFLNNDVEIITESWLEEMLQLCQQKDVGMAGAKLYYPDDTIQHAGVVVGLGGVAAHVLCKLPRDAEGYMGRLRCVQEISAVTAACMMVKTSVFKAVGGFDEELKVAFNDIDLCMKVRKYGVKIVFTPYAELYHYESKSRGMEDTPEKQLRFSREVNCFRRKWERELLKGDPYYNPNLTLNNTDCSLRKQEKNGD